MTKKEFFETEWTRISGFSGDCGVCCGGIGLDIELANRDGSKHSWISVKGLLSVVQKMYFQYNDDDVKMIFDYLNTKEK